MANLKDLSPRELASRAPLDRLDNDASEDNYASDESVDNGSFPTNDTETTELSASGDGVKEDDDGVEDIEEHAVSCACRACAWDKMVCSETVSSNRDWN